MEKVSYEITIKFHLIKYLLPCLGDINYGSDFLEEMMQLNEKLESNDMTENELVQLEMDNQLLIKKMTSQISDAFKCDNFAKAKEILIKMKFYISYGDKLKELFAKKFM